MQIFQPMPLQRRSLPFDDPEWIYELKMDGFRALAVIEHGRAQLISRNGHLFASFSALAESISDSLPNVRAIIDGEICSLEENPGALGDFKRSRPHAERESQVTHDVAEGPHAIGKEAGRHIGSLRRRGRSHSRAISRHPWSLLAVSVFAFVYMLWQVYMTVSH